MTKPKITIGLGIHRPEMLPLMASQMRQHEAIYLEEPNAPNFEAMLTGELGIEDYLRPLDVEYPSFSLDQCSLLRELSAAGKKIYQVEPYLRVLLMVHEFLADGHSPAELDKRSIQYPVYLAERRATGALLRYYQTAMEGSFAETIEAVMQFVRMDAARFRLRDSLRAQEMVPLVKSHHSSYIEAGVIHYPLWGLMRQQLPIQFRLRAIYLAKSVLTKLGKRRNLYGPGDKLTLLYIFHPTLRQSKRETLLAARSLIYSKLIIKQEINKDLKSMPHLSDELACIETVNRLTLNDCRRLFPLVRQASTQQTRQIVEEYLSASTQQRQNQTGQDHQTKLRAGLADVAGTPTRSRKYGGPLKRKQIW